MRKLFLESILRQDMSWYDTSAGNTFANKMTEYVKEMFYSKRDFFKIFNSLQRFR